MRNFKLTRGEKAIDSNAERYVRVHKDEYTRIVKAIAARKKDAVLSIRVNSEDLAGIKRKAERLGIKYQTFISEILHTVAKAN